MRRMVQYGMLSGMLVLLLLGCSSIPRASAQTDSLLVVLADIEGDIPNVLRLTTESGTRRLSFSREGIAFISLAGGTVELPGGIPLNLPEGAVALYPQVFGSGGPLREILPADQRRAMTALTDYVGFESWFGREYLNFGPFRPKQYLSGEYFPLELDSDPAGSLISIDNVAWGETPQTIELNAGKYLVELSAPGYRPYKRIITLEGPLSLSPELEALEKAAGEEKDRFEILVASIRSMNPGDDPYGEIIASTMAVNFSLDPRLSTLRSGTGGGDEYPDFAPAEEAGADLLVTGRYSLEGDTLYLEAVLYEATSRRVKFAETYVTEAGFAVFDSIDEVSARFAEAVSRTLPDPGQPIVETEVGESGELVAYEKSIYRERMIESRNGRKNLLSVKTGLGGLDDRFELFPGSEVGINTQNPPNFYRIDYQRILTGSISLSTSGMIMLQSVDSQDTIQGPDQMASFTLFLGPEFTFRTETSDVYFTPSLTLGVLPSFTVTDTIAPQDYDISTRFYSGLVLDVGYRYFFFRKREDRPVFLNLGMFFDMAAFAFSADEDPRLIPILGGLYLGGGAAL
jgi:PEGA domain